VWLQRAEVVGKLGQNVQLVGNETNLLLDDATLPAARCRHPETVEPLCWVTVAPALGRNAVDTPMANAPLAG